MQGFPKCPTDQTYEQNRFCLKRPTPSSTNVPIEALQVQPENQHAKTMNFQPFSSLYPANESCLLHISIYIYIYKLVLFMLLHVCLFSIRTLPPSMVKKNQLLHLSHNHSLVVIKKKPYSN